MEEALDLSSDRILNEMILLYPSHVVLIIVFLAFDFFLSTCFGLAGIMLPKLQLKQHAHDNVDG